MKKVHAAGSGYHFPNEPECGYPWHEGKGMKTTRDEEKVTCLRCRKILRPDDKEVKWTN